MKKIFELTLASLPACGWADPSFTAFLELLSGASADFPLIIAAFMLFIMPPLPALDVLSDPATFATSLLFPSEPLRRKTSKSVGRLLGEAMPKTITRKLVWLKRNWNSQLTVDRKLIRYAFLPALPSLQRARATAEPFIALRQLVKARCFLLHTLCRLLLDLQRIFLILQSLLLLQLSLLVLLLRLFVLLTRGCTLRTNRGRTAIGAILWISWKS